MSAYASATLWAEGFNRMVKRAAVAAKLGIKAHPHMLRHACGFKLANRHPNAGRPISAIAPINSTTRYAALAPDRFKNIWGKA
jgi:site-specific recombinase XerD